MGLSSIRNFFKNHPKWLGIPAVALILLAVIFFVLAEWATRGAAFIFNREVARQDLLRGTITVEKLGAHINGDVFFTNLVWRDLQGEVILSAPEGGLHVRPWDVVTRHFKSTTIQELHLRDAVLSVRFNEAMQVDFIRPWKEAILPAAVPVEKMNVGEQLDDRLKNFNRNGRKLRLKLNLENCRLESRYRNRHYILNEANLEMEINTSDKARIIFEAGKFGGTMVGAGMTLDGEIDFKADPPQVNMDIAVRDVDPSSLGLGMNVHDKMTLVAKALGPVDRPVATGTVRMKELHIPALDFTQVEGDISYEDSVLKFTDVNAKVYSGKLVARGDYDLNTRKYNIYGKAAGLDSRIALNDLRFACLVDLNLIIRNDGNPKNTLAYGDFHSGPGRYSLIPFESLAGRFSNQHKELDFYDVVIATPFGRITTDAFHIKNGKVHLGTINLTDTQTGENFRLKGWKK